MTHVIALDGESGEWSHGIRIDGAGGKKESASASKGEVVSRSCGLVKRRA